MPEIVATPIQVHGQSVCLAVADLDVATQWYIDLLGAKVIASLDLPQFSSRVAYIESAGVTLELVQTKGFVALVRADPPSHDQLQGFSQLCLWVDSIESALAAVKSREIPIAFPLTRSDALGVESFFIRDCEGNLIEFSQKLKPVDAALPTSTAEVAGLWFRSMGNGDIQTAISLLDDDVEWINYKVIPGYNDAMPWIGTYHGPSAVYSSFKVFTGVCTVKSEVLDRLVISGEDAIGIVHENSAVTATGIAFDIQFIQWLKVRDGKIVFWKSYTDPSPILRALKGPAPEQQTEHQGAKQ